MYYISRGRIKPANKQYTTCKNEYEMMFTADTQVEEVWLIFIVYLFLSRGVANNIYPCMLEVWFSHMNRFSV